MHCTYNIDGTISSSTFGSGSKTEYKYDNGGNLLNTKEYAYGTGALGSVINTTDYTYEDSNWPDKLTVIMASSSLMMRWVIRWSIVAGYLLGKVVDSYKALSNNLQKYSICMTFQEQGLQNPLFSYV